MPQVEMTAPLRTLFPQLGEQPLDVAGQTVAQLVRHLDELAPGIAFYLCDERGRLRQHVNVFVAGWMIVDRKGLSDPLNTESKVFIAQALSGG